MSMINIKRFSSSKTDLVLISLIGLVNPGIFLLMFKRDIWDGTIIDYYLSLNDYEPLRQWFYSSGWELQYYALLFQDKLADALNLPTRYIIISFSILALIGLAIEIYFLAKSRFETHRKIALIIACLFLFLPTWNVLSSSVMNIHIICLFLSLIGVRVFFSESKLKKIFGVCLILTSYQLNSLLFFIPILVFVIEKINSEDIDTNKFRPRRFLFTSLISILYFMTSRLINPNDGLYIGYNQIVFPTSPSLLGLYIHNFLSFSSFLLIPFIPFSLIMLCKFVSNRSGNKFPRLFSTKKLLLFLLLYLGAIFPYIAVGKSTNIFELTDWTQRQGFVLAIPLVLLTGSVISKISEFWEVERRFFRIIITFALTLLLPLSLQFESFAIKLNRQSFESDLITTLKLNSSVPPPGTFQIYGDGIPQPDIRNYESNFLLYETYSKASWWSVIGNNKDLDFSLPLWMTPQHADAYIFEYSQNHCRSDLEIKASGYSSPHGSLLRRFLGVKESRVQIIEFGSSCS
jgi:hypothetical protein